MKTRLYIFLIVTTALTSCRQPENITGTVTNFDGNQPLTKVHVFQKDYPQNDTYTDSLGKFQIKKNGFIEFWGSSLTVVVEKENYQSKDVTFDHCESEFISLKPIK